MFMLVYVLRKAKFRKDSCIKDKVSVTEKEEMIDEKQSKKFSLTFIEKCETHVHQGFGRGVVLSHVAFE